MDQTSLRFVPENMYHSRVFPKSRKLFEFYKNYWNINITFSNIFFSGSFLYDLNIVRIFTKDIYIQKLFVYMRTGVY